MADVGIIEGEQLLIKISNNADPEVLSHPCLINTDRGIAFTTNVTEVEVADCADQSAPAKIKRKVKSKDFTVTGAGKVDKTSVWAYIEWWNSGLPRNAEIVQNVSGANGGWTGEGPLILKDFNVKGTRGDYQEFDATFVPSDTFDWTQNA
jgi:hypothetical protein